MSEFLHGRNSSDLGVPGQGERLPITAEAPKSGANLVGRNRFLPRSLMNGLAALRLSGALVVSMMPSDSSLNLQHFSVPVVRSASVNIPTETIVKPSLNTLPPEGKEPGIEEIFEDIMEWFNKLDGKQQVAVAMYGLMGLYFTRFIARGTKAAIDPRGEIKLRKLKESPAEESVSPEDTDYDFYDYDEDFSNEPKPKAPEYEVDLRFFRDNLKRFRRSMSQITAGERLDAVRNSIVKDPQNTRSAIGVSGFLTASTIHFMDNGNIGNIDVNTNILIVSLFAALIPSFKAFDRYREKMHLEIIQKTAASVAGSFLGISESGIYFKSDDTTFLQLFVSALAFGVLFAYGDMGTGSRDFSSAIFDGLKVKEALRRYDSLLKNRRISHQARMLEEALMDGNMHEVLKKNGILNKSLALVKRSFLEDGIDPSQLAISLSEWRKQVKEAVVEFMDLANIDNEGESGNGKRTKRQRLILHLK